MRPVPVHSALLKMSMRLTDIIKFDDSLSVFALPLGSFSQYIRIALCLVRNQRCDNSATVERGWPIGEELVKDTVHVRWLLNNL